MVAQIFTDIADFEIRVSWHDATTGYVSGVKFQIEDDNVIFPGHPTFNNPSADDREISLALAFAVRHTPEFDDAKRFLKSTNLVVVNGNFPGVYSVNNPLNGSIYNVVLHPNKTYCECPDHQYRHIECKHIKAVKRHVEPAEKTPILMPSYHGKAISAGRLQPIKSSEITDEMIADAKASLGW